MLFKNNRHCACCKLAQQCHQYRQFQTPLQSSDHHSYTRSRCCARPAPVDRAEVFFGLALVLGTFVLLVESLPYQEWNPTSGSRSNNKISSDTASSQKRTIQSEGLTKAAVNLTPQTSITTKQTNPKLNEATIEPSSADSKTNEIARNVLEQILRQYYSRVLGSMMMVRKPALVESQVVSKRRQEIPSTSEQIIMAPQQSYTKDDSSSSLEDHYLLIENYARSPLDFFTTTTNSTTNTENSLNDAPVTSDNKRRAVVSDNTMDSSNQYSISSGDGDNYIEALLNEIAIDQMLNQQERARSIQISDQSQLDDGDHEEVDADMSTNETNNEINDHGNYEQQENSNDFLSDTDMNIRATFSPTINELSDQKDGRLRNILLRRQEHHQSTVAPAFISSLASSFAMDDNFSKSHIRFHPCYFNPISCFTKR